MATTTRASRSRRIDPDEVVEDAKPPFDVEDDEDEAPKPRRRSTRATTRDEDEAPKPRRRSTRVKEEDGDEDQDGEETVVPVFRGKDAIKANRPNDSGSLFFKWKDDGESSVVKFLADDDDNLAWSYNQHWVTRSGKQSFPCIGKDCPLCEIGAKVSQKIVYTVLNLTHDDGPTVQVMEVTPTVSDDLEGLDSGKTGPLTRLSWEVSRPKKARPTGFAKYNYQFVPVKDRDLGDDYNIDLDVVDAALEKIETLPSPSEVLGKVNRKVLQEIADEVMGGK
jgi:hypothetical protein